ncbi:MAG: DUF3795 domain-containing protein [Methanosarcinales archaeon]|jgi:hypothetical protein|nr:DUF3795 domain-containing protein [Methanosarcinales archaeon]
MINPCGADCSKCKLYRKTCDGCRESKGFISWGDEIGKKLCPIYDCAVNKKKLNHCGGCSEIPCEYYFENVDPNITLEERAVYAQKTAQFLKELDKKDKAEKSKTENNKVEKANQERGK